VFEAAIQFARSEGIVAAPESAHALRATIDEALRARDADERRVVLFNLSGHGHFDMAAYDAYLAGTLQDYAYPTEAIQQALTELPRVAVTA
jgi:predicted alternative tryptophan synthase beta-subunit